MCSCMCARQRYPPLLHSLFFLPRFQLFSVQGDPPQLSQESQVRVMNGWNWSGPVWAIIHLKRKKNHIASLFCFTFCLKAPWDSSYLVMSRLFVAGSSCWNSGSLKQVVNSKLQTGVKRLPNSLKQILYAAAKPRPVINTSVVHLS